MKYDFDYKAVSGSGNREQNEDCYEIVIKEDRCGVFLCDGLGGHRGGEDAAGMAVREMTGMFEQQEAPFSCEKLLEAAHATLLASQGKRADRSSYKTTAAVFLSDGKKAFVGYAGDSRVYLFYHGKVFRKTADHSVAQMLVLSGQIKPEELMHHPDRNLLTKALGMNGEGQAYEVLKPERLRKCEAVLLCTDGFWEWIDEVSMCDCLRQTDSAEEWLAAMEKIVLENAGQYEMDNYTAVVLRRGSRRV